MIRGTPMSFSKPPSDYFLMEPSRIFVEFPDKAFWSYVMYTVNLERSSTPSNPYVLALPETSIKFMNGKLTVNGYKPHTNSHRVAICQNQIISSIPKYI
jgi:hypothetical protein